jgi:hypothetical protein
MIVVAIIYTFGLILHKLLMNFVNDDLMISFLKDGYFSFRTN